MPSLDSTFDELRAQLQSPEVLNPAKSDPVFYLVHAPSETLEVKKKIPLWAAILRNDGREVLVVSFADLVWRIIDNSGRWEDWLSVESEHQISEINDAIRDVLRAESAFVAAVAEYVTEPVANRIVFLTDAGLVHPYFRVRTLESSLHDNFKVPTVIFYPGRRSGQYGLHFLGFYSVDGNYRSTLIGGQS
jgi:hypothetical protein